MSHSCSARGLALALLLTGLSAEPAAGQQQAAPEPAAESSIQPPMAEQTPVEYPEAGEGNHVVVLELLIERDGSVSESRVLRGSAPFSEAARKASYEWRFSPAERDGVRVRSRIRFAVKFERKQVPLPGAVEPDDTVEAEGGTTQQAPIEIEVRGERRHAASTSFTRAEAQQLPGAFGDPTRTLDMMPGVSPIVSALPLFFVRGAPPGNVGFFIDGVRIPLLYHVFLGPSVVHPGLIERVDLYAAAYPAQYGRFAGAVVRAKLKEPEPRLGGEASVRLLDSGALVEAPFAAGRGTATLGGRYSYTGLIVSALTGNELKYWDYQGLVSYQLTRNNRVSVFAFGALDYVNAGQQDVGGTSFHRIDLRLDHEFSPNTSGRLAATWGQDKTLSDVGSVSDRMLAGRAELEHHAGSEAIFRVGLDAVRDAYSLDIEPAAAERIIYETLFPTRTDSAFGAYAELELIPADWYSVKPGVRADLFRSLGVTEASVDPRVTATFRAYEEVRLFHAVGMAHQTPNFVPAIPGAQVAGLEGGLQRTLHSESGVELGLPSDFDLTVSYFQNVYFKLTDPAGTNQSLDIDEGSSDRRATGHAYGVELHLKRPLTQRVGGILSYTASRTTRSYGRVKTLSAYDRTHVANAALVVDLGGGYNAGVRAAVASGVPGGREVPPDKVFDQSRSRPYIRLDAKLQKRWRLTDTAWWGVHAEVLNANAGTEVIRRTCNRSSCEDTVAPPLVLPSVGIEGAF